MGRAGDWWRKRALSPTLAPEEDSPSQFLSPDHPILTPCSPTYFLPSLRLLLFVAILSKACFKIQAIPWHAHALLISAQKFFVKLNFAAIPYHYLQNPCYVSSVINAAMRRSFKLKSKIAHQISETSFIYFVKIPVQFPQIYPFSGEIRHGDWTEFALCREKLTHVPWTKKTNKQNMEKFFSTQSAQLCSSYVLPPASSPPADRCLQKVF